MDVADWLRALGLERYEATFRENEVDAELLPTLAADDLREIRITSFGHRRQQLAAIAKAADGQGRPPLRDRSAKMRCRSAVNVASSLDVLRPGGVDGAERKARLQRFTPGRRVAKHPAIIPQRRDNRAYIYWLSPHPCIEGRWRAQRMP
jgi:hypothetical protein